MKNENMNYVVAPIVAIIMGLLFLIAIKMLGG
jgi:hypothetical protein